MCFRGISLRYARGLDILTVGLGGLGRILSLCWFRSICSGRCSRLILVEILDLNFLRSRRLLGGSIFRDSTNFTSVFLLCSRVIWRVRSLSV